MSIEESLSRTDRALKESRLRSFLELCEAGIREFPELSLLYHYNSGALCFNDIGNGEKARSYFEAAWVDPPDRIHPEGCRTAKANACENMMILSLSYEEYDQWANRLKEYDPGNRILVEQTKMIRELRDSLLPWSHAMLRICGPYLREDVGLFGMAASVMQLMLKNRAELRLNHSDHRQVVLVYAALPVRLTGKTGERMHRECGGSDPREFDFILEDAIPAVEEYTKEYPDDGRVTELAGWMRRTLTELRQWASAQSNGTRRGADPSGNTEVPAAGLTHKAFNLVEQRRYREAIAVLEQAIESDPQCGDAYNELAFIYGRAMRDWEKAEEYARRAMECDCGNPKFQNTLFAVQVEIAKQLKTKKQVEEAAARQLAAIDRAIRDNPAYASLHLARAGLLALQGARREEWEGELEKAKDIYAASGHLGTHLEASPEAVGKIMRENNERCAQLATLHDGKR